MSDAEINIAVAQSFDDAVMSQPRSSWGQPPDRISIKAKLKYQKILNSIATIGEFAVFVLTVATFVALVWFLFFINFGNIVLDDGTAFHCVMDGLTGEIYAPRK